MPNDEIVNVRYMVSDVEESIAFYTTMLDFELLTSAAPAFADVKRGNLRLLLAGPKSSAGRPMPDGATPGPGGWNRIHFIVDDLASRSRATPRRRRDVPQRRGGRPRRQADPAAGPFRQHGRALPARRPLVTSARHCLAMAMRSRSSGLMRWSTSSAASSPSSWIQWMRPVNPLSFGP